VDYSALIFRQLFDSSSSTYTYLLADPQSREAVLIDPVFEQHDRDRALIEELGLTLLYTLDTHCHADHVTGAWRLQQSLGSKIAISGRYGDMIEGADRRLDHGDTVPFGGRSLSVRATPGHTDGCITYVLDDRSMAFTGDCLLIRGAGRCDFQQGNASVMYRSIKEQIFTLPETCTIYPGHDYSGRTASTVAEEKQYNSRIGGQATEKDFVGYMDNLGLPHPKKIDVAIPGNCRCGRPEDGQIPGVIDWAPVRQTYGGLREIDPQWVAEHLSEVTVIDVREADEFNNRLGHIAGAQLIPLGTLRDAIAQIPQDKPVVSVCQSGSRSGQATVILRKAGLEQTANLRGGMLEWNHAGLPVERQSPVGVGK
jgi:sulfur dioxygenase